MASFFLFFKYHVESFASFTQRFWLDGQKIPLFESFASSFFIDELNSKSLFFQADTYPRLDNVHVSMKKEKKNNPGAIELTEKLWPPPLHLR